MIDDLARLETWIGELLAKLSPAQRLRVARRIAVYLRRSQSRRIAAQRNPDGSSYAPRKPRDTIRGRLGGVRRSVRARAMFGKIRTARFMKTQATPSEAAVGFANAAIARIARVHQQGLRDRVERRSGAPEADYPARELIGFTDEEMGEVLDLVLEALQA